MRHVLWKWLALWVIPAVFVFSSGIAFAGEWEEIGREEGIVVSTQEVANSPLLAFRGVTVMNHSAERLMRVLVDNEHRTRWVDRLERSVILQRNGPFDYVLYQHFGLPIPISDRDYVYRARGTRSKATGTVSLHFESTRHPKAPDSVGVRARLLRSYYRMTPIGKNKTRVEVEIHTDPKGWLPAWLVNMIQKSWPVKTLSALRVEAGKAWVTPAKLPQAR